MTEALKRNPALAILIGLLVLAFWCTNLSFIPVPWPDDSAFYLTGLYWINWPSKYLMHSQAPFVPTYDIANFNTMPGMPFFLGIGRWLGIDTAHGIRIYGMVALAAWAWLLMAWMQTRGLRRSWIWAISLAAVLSPAIRWGAMVVRPEVWQGLFWLLILLEMDGFFRRKSAWTIPLILAAGAYIHFEAIIWVLPTAAMVALTSENASQASRRLAGIAWRTALLLSPWVVYVLWHWDVFWIQMQTQFGRLEEHHPYIQSLYGFVHNLFLTMGSPLSYPKLFNPGKAITWGAILIGSFRVLYLAWRNPSGDQTQRALRIGSWFALMATFYLWVTKPETWFTAMIHMALWPMVVLAFRSPGRNEPATKARPLATRAALACILLLIVLQAALTVTQWRKLHGTYTWENYAKWIDCIDQSIGTRTSVWQPNAPDILVELASRKPERDYTRAADFEGIMPLLERHAARTEAVVHSLFLDPADKHARESHQGDAREIDRYYVTEYPWLPYTKLRALQSKELTLKVCQVGPFWAALQLR